MPWHSETVKKGEALYPACRRNEGVMDICDAGSIRKRLLFTCLLVVALSSTLFLGSVRSIRGQNRYSGTPPDTGAGHNSILEGIDDIYNLEFDAAEDVFRKMISKTPDKPAGYFYLAMVTWSRLIAGFWSQENVAEYIRRIHRAIDIAGRNIRTNPSDSYNYFYLGGAQGFLARFELMRGKWFSSFLLARKAVKALKKCLEVDPGNRDVLLGIGIFDYYTSRFSGAAKFLSYLLVHKGSREKGLKRLHIAAEQAVYSKTEAKSVLLYIYLFLEEDYLKALDLAEQLGQKYNRDPSYKYYQGVCFIKLGDDENYRDIISFMRQKIRTASSHTEALKWERRLLYLKTTRDLFHGNFASARKNLTQILNHPDPANDPTMIALPLLKTGMIYELEGNRQKASEYYRRVINMKNPAGVQFLAKRFLESSVTKGDPLIAY